MKNAFNNTNDCFFLSSTKCKASDQKTGMVFMKELQPNKTPPTWKQGQAAQLCRKTEDTRLLWSHESKSELSGCRRTFVHQRAAEQKIMRVCRRWRLPERLGCVSEKCRQILLHHAAAAAAGRRQIGPDWFCSRTMAPDTEPRSSRATFSLKKSMKSWE